MTQAIWKQSIALIDRQQLYVPKGAKMLSVAVQHGVVCLWFRCDTLNDPENRTIRIFGTGHIIPEGLMLTYIGTILTHEGDLVWHVFEEI